jgi:hypothetical protein
MLQAIVDPAIRLPALTAFMLKMSASDDAKLLSRAQSMAWTTFETLNAYRRSDYAAELFTPAHTLTAMCRPSPK